MTAAWTAMAPWSDPAWATAWSSCAWVMTGVGVGVGVGVGDGVAAAADGVAATGAGESSSPWAAQDDRASRQDKIRQETLKFI